MLADLARERNFDPASVDAPVTLTESHDDPVVRYDGIWVAGLDAAQWPPPPRPDAFIPLRLQAAAGIPAASAAGQARLARAALAAWRAATDALVCSWARLDGDAQRTPSPLLTRLAVQQAYQPARRIHVAGRRAGTGGLEHFDDVHRRAPVDIRGDSARAASSRSPCRPSAASMPTAKCGSARAARSAGAGHRRARARHVAAQGARAGVDQARPQQFSLDATDEHDAPSDDRRMRWQRR